MKRSNNGALNILAAKGQLTRVSEKNFVVRIILETVVKLFLCNDRKFNTFHHDMERYIIHEETS